jgi:hypothetical protein
MEAALMPLLKMKNKIRRAAVAMALMVGLAGMNGSSGSVARSVAGDESLAVPGSDHRYPVKIDRDIGERKVSLVITGAAQRTKTTFKVYTVASYVEQGVAIRDALELATQDCPKQLHITMQRDVDGATMADAFIDGIRLNYGDDQFAGQRKALLEFMAGTRLREGDQVWLTHVPEVGFHCRMPGNRETLIKDVPFSAAIWKIYLGRKNISDDVKQALTARLPLAAAVP